MRIILAGGGTGGHIYPAIAIADEIQKKDKDAVILFMGAKGKLEESIIPANGYELKTIEIAGLNRRQWMKNLILPFKVIGAVKKSKKIIKDFNPDVVAGTGGYASAPVVYAASKLGIPTLIQGGDSFPGRTTKFLSKYADRVVINFSETKNFLKRKDNVINIAHPVRSTLSKVSREEANKLFGIENDFKTIFIFGGSQGAMGINRGIERIVEELYRKELNIIWQTGKGDYDELRERYSEMKSRVKIYEYIENMGHAYSAADLVICRAGISSIMELAYLQMPALLIPYPYAAEYHQEKNARSLESVEAGLVLLEEELEEKLHDTIVNSLNDGELLKKLRENIKTFSDPDAASKIVIEIYKLAS